MQKKVLQLTFEVGFTDIISKEHRYVLQFRLEILSFDSFKEKLQQVPVSVVTRLFKSRLYTISDQVNSFKMLLPASKYCCLNRILGVAERLPTAVRTSNHCGHLFWIVLDHQLLKWLFVVPISPKTY